MVTVRTVIGDRKRGNFKTGGFGRSAMIEDNRRRIWRLRLPLARLVALGVSRAEITVRNWRAFGGHAAYEMKKETHRCYGRMNARSVT
jgi:hypothetical protein